MLDSRSTTTFTDILWYVIGLGDSLRFAYYSILPQDFVVVVDSNLEKVLHIDFPAHYKLSPNGTAELTAPSTAPPSLDADSFASSKRERIPPPREPHNFLPDLLLETEKNFKFRDDIKPLHIVQPEGVSFKMNGNELEWQNWKMHIGM